MGFGSFLRSILRPLGFPEQSRRALPTFNPVGGDGRDIARECRIVSGEEANAGACSVCRRGCSRHKG